MTFRDFDIIPNSFQDSEINRLLGKGSDIRPQEEGVLQLQMDDMDLYMVFSYPDSYVEFDNPVKLEYFLRKQVKDEALLQQGLSLMSNFKLANIDLNQGVAYSVLGYSKVG